MCFGYGGYSKSLRTGSMRPSSTQRRRWRKRGLEILQHGTFCCVYLACPLQRQTPGTRWDLNLLQWAVAPQRAWIIYIIGHLRASACFEADAAPAVSRTSEVWWWNGETVERRWILSDGTGGVNWGARRPTRRMRWRAEPFLFTPQTVLDLKDAGKHFFLHVIFN